MENIIVTTELYCESKFTFRFMPEKLIVNEVDIPYNTIKNVRMRNDWDKTIMCISVNEQSWILRIAEYPMTQNDYNNINTILQKYIKNYYDYKNQTYYNLADIKQQLAILEPQFDKLYTLNELADIKQQLAEIKPLLGQLFLFSRL